MGRFLDCLKQDLPDYWIGQDWDCGGERGFVGCLKQDLPDYWIGQDWDCGGGRGFLDCLKQDLRDYRIFGIGAVLSTIYSILVIPES